MKDSPERRDIKLYGFLGLWLSYSSVLFTDINFTNELRDCVCQPSLQKNESGFGHETIFVDNG